MKVKKIIIFFIAIGLLACNGNAGKISDHWFGSYNIGMVYGEPDEESPQGDYIGYGIEIDKDSCTFSGAGFQTYFEYLCKVQENKNELHLLYLELIDGFDLSGRSPLDTIATLIKDGRRYYIKSSIIADKNWEYRKKLPLNKKLKKRGD